MPENSPNTDTLNRVVEALNKRRPESTAGYLSDHCTLDSSRGPYPYGQRFVGKEAVLGALAAFFDRVPDAQFKDPQILIAHDRGFVLSNVIGTSRSGERLDAQACDIYEFLDDQIVRIDSYWKHSI